MKTTSILAAAALGLTVFSARADISTNYTLVAGSAFTEELVCLPPCSCEYAKWAGPMTGTFTLTRAVSGPIFDEYNLTNASFTASVKGQKVKMTGYGHYVIGGDFVVQQQLTLDLMVDGTLEHFDSGLVMMDPNMPFPQISISPAGNVGCGINTVTMMAMPGNTVCYPNCDASTNLPLLNVNDFVCFLGMFASGSPYANCDGSAQEPVLNVNDFVCFLNAFAAGCS